MCVSIRLEGRDGRWYVLAMCCVGLARRAAQPILFQKSVTCGELKQEAPLLAV